MKKTYITPAAKAIQISTSRIICESPDLGFDPNEFSNTMHSFGRDW